MHYLIEPHRQKKKKKKKPQEIEVSNPESAKPPLE